MPNFLNKFEFDKPPKKIEYFDYDPLCLNSEFVFFHNKSKFRRELTRLQNLIKSFTSSPLTVAGIRDSYIREELTEKYLVLLFTTPEIVQNINQIIDDRADIEFKPSCFLLESTSKYVLLLTREMEGLNPGINMLESILNQVLEDYKIQKKFDEFIMIRRFKIIDCAQ